MLAGHPVVGHTVYWGLIYGLNGEFSKTDINKWMNITIKATKYKKITYKSIKYFKNV